MTESGRVIEVTESLRGSALTAAAAIGAVELDVEGTEDFEEGGGQLRLNGVTYAFGAPDDDVLTVPLASPLTVAGEEGDAVLIWPNAVERYASVVLEDAPEAPISALVPHALVGRLPVGLRTDGDMDAVEVRETAAGSWVVTDLLGRASARAGISETDWRNGRGISLLLGDEGSDVAAYLFNGFEMVAENAGPVAPTIPAANSGTFRKVGRTGIDTGLISITTDFPAKVTLAGVASVLNAETAASGLDFNVRFYLAVIDPATGDVFLGRQGTAFCNAGDLASNRHRQVHNERQYGFDASGDDPQTRHFWWGFTTDAQGPRDAQIRNMKMTLRVAYAPDIPTAASPERSPLWTPFADTIASYTRVEGDDAL